MTGRPSAASADPTQVAARMLALIDVDLAERGWSPVARFADLHDFTDANDYATEALDDLGFVLSDGEVTDADFAVLNAATALVDGFLAARAPVVAHD